MITQGEDEAWNFTYDKEGNVSKYVFSGEKSFQYTFAYDQKGNIIEAIDASDQPALYFEYDNENRLTLVRNAINDTLGVISYSENFVHTSTFYSGQDISYLMKNGNIDQYSCGNCAPMGRNIYTDLTIAVPNSFLKIWDYMNKPLFLGFYLHMNRNIPEYFASTIGPIYSIAELKNDIALNKEMLPVKVNVTVSEMIVGSSDNLPEVLYAYQITY